MDDVLARVLAHLNAADPGGVSGSISTVQPSSSCPRTVTSTVCSSRTVQLKIQDVSLERETELDEERLGGFEIVDNDEDVVHSCERHVPIFDALQRIGNSRNTLAPPGVQSVDRRLFEAAGSGRLSHAGARPWPFFSPS
jgi:hypothetical protein